MWFVLDLQLIPILLSILTIPLFPQQLNIHNSNLTLDDTEYEEFTAIEINGLKRFREIIHQELQHEYERSDDFLIRWLRDCDMNVQSAATMLRKAMEWRKENDIDNVLNKTFFSTKNQTCFQSGFDKKGAPILIFKFASVDLRKLITKGRTGNVVHQWERCVEQYIKKSIKGRMESIRMTTGITLVNAQGYSIKEHGWLGCVGLYKRMFTRLSNFYPQSSKLIIVINAPPFAKPVIEMVKPFISPYYKKILEQTEKSGRLIF